MQRKRIAKFGIALVAMALIALIAGCPSGDNGGSPSGEKNLTAITVAGVSAGIPTAITRAQWEDTDLYLVTVSGVVQTITLPNTGALTGAVISVSVSGGNWALAQGFDGTRGDLVFGTGATRTFAANELLFVRVTADDGSVQYYAFQITTPSANANINTIIVDGVAASKGNPAAAWDAGTISAGLVIISSQNASSAAVVATAEANGATVKLAKVTGSGAPSFGSDTTFSFADGDFLYIEVTAQDGTTKQIYKIEIGIGRNVELSVFTIADVDVEEGTPGTDWNVGVTAGAFDYQEDDPPAGGFVLVVTPVDSLATIEYAVVADGTTDPTSTFTALTGGYVALTLTGGEFIYVKVTSGNGLIFRFYKLAVTMKQARTVLYAQPDIEKGIAGAAPKIDVLWDTIGWDFDISRVNLNEMVPRFRFLNTVDGHYNDTGYGHTEGRAKVFWDDFGLYVYAEVDYHDYYNEDPNNEGQPLSSLSARTTHGSADGLTSNNHERDSLEIFINERRQAYKSGYYGNQFRISPSSNTPGNSVISGDAISAGGIDRFRDDDTYYSWVRKDGSNKEIGYSVIAYVPFLEKASNDADEVFDNTGKVMTVGDDAGPAIGAELQLNVVAESGRDAILTWNGIAGASYHNVQYYGKLELITGDLDARGITRGDKDPTRVKGVTVSPSAIDLVGGLSTTLTATVRPSAALDKTVSWSSDNSSVATVNSDGKVSAVLGASGTATITATTTDGSFTSSCVVTVIAYDEPTDWAERITINNNTSAPVYGFILPSGKTFGDYTSISFDVKKDPGTIGNQGRLRAWGPYTLDEFGTDANGEWNRLSLVGGSNMGNDGAGGAGGRLLTTAGYASFEHDDWEPVTLTIAATGNGVNNADADAMNAKEDIILLAFGYIGGGTPPDGADGNKVYYVKNIKLVADDATTADALYPGHPVLGGGEAYKAYVHQSGSQVGRDVVLPGTILAPYNDTLFSSVGSYASGEKYTHTDGKKYWIISDCRVDDKDAWLELPSSFAALGDIYDLQTAYSPDPAGYTRITQTIDDIDVVGWVAGYDSVTLTYDVVPICGDLNITARNSKDGSESGDAGPTPVAGTDKTMTMEGSGRFTTGGISITKGSGNGAFLMRITKISLHND